MQSKIQFDNDINLRGGSNGELQDITNILVGSA